MRERSTISELSDETTPPSAAIVLEGDCLDVLTSRGQDLRGAVRCVYLDPPYNNGERYTHYDDRASHDEWLSSMESRLAPLLDCLRPDGSIWISIDDNQMHYLKVAADRIFGRERFVTTVIWEHRRSRENRKAFSNNHEYLLVYAHDVREFTRTRSRIDAREKLERRYSNPDHDPRGPWQSITATAQAGHATAAQYYELVAPDGRRHRPPKGRCWVYDEQRMREKIDRGEIWFGRSGDGVPRVKRYLAEADLAVTPNTLWTADFAGTTEEAKRHILQLSLGETAFDTPKPELLISRVLEIATSPGDLVLDPFAGSGTTSAAALKLHRNSISIEVESATVNVIARRLQAVTEGEPGGISRRAGWSGGGTVTVGRQLSLSRSAA